MKKSFHLSLVGVLLASILLVISHTMSAQTEADYQYVDSLAKAGQPEQAYLFAKEKHLSCSPDRKSVV